MKKFKDHKRCDEYRVCFIEAEDKEDALLQALHGDQDWDFVETDGEEIIGIDELNEQGDEAEQYHYLENNKFIDTVKA